MPKTASKKVTFRDSVHEVEHRKIDIDTKALRREITAAIKEHGIETLWLDPPTFFDAKEKRSPWGLAFAISKFEPSFHESMPGNTFRYKDTEVQAAPREIIRQHPECTGLVRWDRGMGVFVFNVFLQKV
jgi:hypothetical protein